MVCFTLPDLLGMCTFPCATNPHYEKASAESRAWIDSYGVLSGAKRDFFIRSNADLLVAYAYPCADYEAFRTCCDFMNIIFVIDDLCDDLSAEETRVAAEPFVRGMRDNVFDSSVVSRMTKEFRQRFVKRAGPGCIRRFADLVDRYIDAVAYEAELRDRGEVLDLQSYTYQRRHNSAIPISFGMFEYVFGVDLPDKVWEDETFLRVFWSSIDMLTWANDIYSYQMELRKGLASGNAITLLMQERGLTLQQVSDYVGDLFHSMMSQFQLDKAELQRRSWSPKVRTLVSKYITWTEFGVRGTLEWDLTTPRYFGSRADEIRKTLVVHL